MNLFTALLVGVATGAAGFILFRYFDHNPPGKDLSFIPFVDRGMRVRYQLLAPVVLPTILSALLWLRWIPVGVWVGIVVLYGLVLIFLPWLKGNFRLLTWLLGGLEVLLAVVALALHYAFHSPAMGRYALMLLYLLLPVTALAAFFALFVPDFLPMPPGMDEKAQADFRRQAGSLFAAFFCGFPKPIVAVQNGELVNRNGGNPFLGTGPGLLMTEPEYAVLIRDGARVRRVVGPGVLFTGGGDVADYVFDLRRQQRGTRVRARTREGIELEAPLSSIFHLQRGEGEREPQLDHPWPYRPSAAIKLYFSRLVDPEDKTPLDAHKPQPWQDLPLKEGGAILKQVISRYTLDEIYGTLLPDQQRQSVLLRVQMGAEVRRQVETLMKEKGIQVIGGSIGGTIKPLDESIFKQRIKAWQAQWAQKALQREIEESVEQLRAFSRIRQQVLQELLTGLKEQVDHYHEAGKEVPPSAILSLRLLETFEDMAHRSEAQEFLPEGLIKTLDELHSRMLNGNGQSSEAKEV